MNLGTPLWLVDTVRRGQDALVHVRHATDGGRPGARKGRGVRAAGRPPADEPCSNIHVATLAEQHVPDDERGDLTHGERIGGCRELARWVECVVDAAVMVPATHGAPREVCIEVDPLAFVAWVRRREQEGASDSPPHVQEEIPPLGNLRVDRVGATHTQGLGFFFFGVRALGHNRKGAIPA